jgi:hypothetical protein
MNCFNIRELQGILKRKFFVDLVNSHDHRSILEESMVGMRYKANHALNLELDYTSFYNFGLHNSANRDSISYSFIGNGSVSNNRVFIDGTSYSILKAVETLTPLDIFSGLTFSNFFSRLYNTLVDVVLLILYINPITSLPTLLNFKLVFDAFLNSFYFIYSTNTLSEINSVFTGSYGSVGSEYTFSKDSLTSNDSKNSIFSESSQDQRFTRFGNPLINYDYKTGNYIGNWESQYPYLINSFIEVARGIRKPS